MLKRLPNTLPALRILLRPVLVGLMAGVAGGTVERLVLVVLFLVMAVTDWLDGYLARRLDASTPPSPMFPAGSPCGCLVWTR